MNPEDTTESPAPEVPTPAAEPVPAEDPAVIEAPAPETAPDAEPEEKSPAPAGDGKPFRLRSGPTYEERRAQLVEEVEACEASVAKHRNAMKKASRTVAELAAHDLDTQNAVAEYRKEDASWQSAVDSLNRVLDDLRSCDANPEQFESPDGEAPSSPAEEEPSFDGRDVTFLDVPEEEYHAAARARSYTSSHYLALFRRCPALYRQEMLGLVPRKDSAAFALGRAAHVAILQGEAEFNRLYRVDDGPINERTNKPYASGTKAWEEYFAGETRTVLSNADFGVIQNMCASVVGHSAAMALLVAGRAEGTIRVPDFCGLPCQIRIDWFNPELGIVDLKTCSDLDRFAFDAKDFGYVHQMAFYRQVLAAAFPQAAGAPVHIVAVEKQQPYRVGVWEVARPSLDRAAAGNIDALGRLKLLLEDPAASWPTGYEASRILSL